MLCPWCGQEMQAGTLAGSDRACLSWRPGGVKRRFMDALGGRGVVKNAHRGLWRFTLSGHYCDHCKKMILDTDIRK